MKAIRRYEGALMWLLLIFMIVYPFIMGFRVEELSGIAETYFAKKTGYSVDIFQYYKEVALIVFSVVLAVLLCVGAALASVMEEKLPGRYRIDGKVLGLTGVFLLLNIVSSIQGGDTMSMPSWDFSSITKDLPPSPGMRFSSLRGIFCLAAEGA